MYLVADAMTAAPLTVKPDEPLGDAAALMRHARVRHLPVVHHGKLVGLLTQSDLLRQRAPGSDAVAVREAMVTDVVTATAQLPLRRAARILFEHKFGCLPVVDAHRTVVGILTETDFIRFAAEIATELDRAEAAASRVAQ